MTKTSIYISTSEANIETAQLIAMQLEGDGYLVWVGDHHTDLDWPNIQKVVDDALHFADADINVLVNGSDPNKVETARERSKPILVLNTGESLLNLLAELKDVTGRAGSQNGYEPSHSVSAPPAHVSQEKSD